MRSGTRGFCRSMDMELAAFKSSLAGAAPPAGVSLPAQALWWQAKGDWHRAHGCCQDPHDGTGARAHAYLHPVEGDQHNAGGWDQQAGTTASGAPPEQGREENARAV